MRHHRHVSLADVNRELDAAFTGASATGGIMDWGPFTPASTQRRAAKVTPPFCPKTDRKAT